VVARVVDGAEEEGEGKEKIEVLCELLVVLGIGLGFILFPEVVLLFYPF